MKWKHKTKGWIARTQEYVPDKKYISFKNVVVNIAEDAKEKSIDNDKYVPAELVILDESNWEEIPDERWLDHFNFTVRQFMEAFAMTISESGGCHDSAVAKGMVDNLIDKIHHNTWVAYNQEPVDNFLKHKID